MTLYNHHGVGSLLTSIATGLPEVGATTTNVRSKKPDTPEMDAVEDELTHIRLCKAKRNYNNDGQQMLTH